MGAGGGGNLALAISNDRYGQLAVEEIAGLIEIGPAVIYAAEPFGDYAATFISPNIEKQLGYTPLDFLGHPGFWASKIHPEDAPRVFEELATLFEQGSHSHEYRFRDAAGHWRWMRDELNLLRDWKGEPWKIVGYWLDITEAKETEQALARAGQELERKVETRTAELRAEIASHKRTEQSLRESEERFRVIAEATPTPTVITHLSDRVILFANTRAQELAGIPYDREVVGLHVSNDWADQNDHLAFLEEVQEKGRVEEREILIKQPDGSLHTMLAFADKITFDGEPAIFTSFTDITDRKRMEAQLRISQRLEAVGRLAGGIAHEFNNIHAALLLRLELLESLLGGPESLKRHVTLAIKTVGRAAGLTRQLLAFAERAPLQPTLIDLSTSLDDLAKLHETTDKEIDLQFGVVENTWPVLVDCEALEQVLFDLVKNAKDSMQAGAPLRIHLSNAFLGEGDMRLPPDQAPGDYVALAVIDTGGGIPQDLLTDVLDPFVSTRDVGQGAGLGLSGAYGFANQSGGFLEILSRIGYGTAATIYLPRAR